MIWLTLVLTAAPLDDVPPLVTDGRAAEATATAKDPIAGKTCTFTPRSSSDAAVRQWVAACPVESVQLVVEGRFAAVRLFTQTNIWKLLAFDATRAAEFEDPGQGQPVAPAWVPPTLVAALMRKHQDRGETVARDPVVHREAR